MGTAFSVYDIRGRVDESLTTEYVWNVGKALADWLPDDGVVIVAQSEEADATTVHALTEGLLLQGRGVVDAGQATKDALQGIVIDKQAAGGVHIAHDPLQGIEIITILGARGVAVTQENGLTDIDQLVQAGNFVPAAAKGETSPL